MWVNRHRYKLHKQIQTKHHSLDYRLLNKDRHNRCKPLLLCR